MINLDYCYISKKLKSIFVFGLVLWISSNVLHAQYNAFDATELQNNSISIQKTGMLILGSWATLNIISGIPGALTRKNSEKYFHQMNAAWNVVNLGIAVFGYLSAINTDIGTLSSSELLSELESFDRILLINAALDVAYIGIGAWLWNKGINKNSNRMDGYGKSLILQGSFLLIFDTILYFIHHQETANLTLLNSQISIYANGFSIAF